MSVSFKSGRTLPVCPPRGVLLASCSIRRMLACRIRYSSEKGTFTPVVKICLSDPGTMLSM